MSGAGTTRRDALKMFAAGAATLVAGCKPAEHISPYRDMPEGMVPGLPLFYATSLPLAGAGRGMLIETHEGRPTKVHGNPLHPASLGGTDVFAEAAVLDLFDPSRAGVPLQSGKPASWSAVDAALGAASQKDGAVLLTGPVGSPTMARQITALLKARPGMRWVSYGTVYPALRLPDAQIWPDFGQLDAIISLGADPLGPGPGQMVFARQWAGAKRDRRAAFRAHVFEPGPTLTGAQAQRRTTVRPSELSDIAQALLAGLDGATPASGPVAEAMEMLRAAPERAAVFGGPDLTGAAEAAIMQINRRLGAPLRYLRPFDYWEGLSPASIDTLVADMAAGRVPALIALGANPVYDLGGRFTQALGGVKEVLHFGTSVNETATRSGWHGPLHHPLEDWSDLRAIDGTVGLVQPVIAPLHDSRSVHRVLDAMTGPGADPYAILQETWRGHWGDADFKDRWMQALHDGVVAGTGPEDTTPKGASPAAVPARKGGEGIELSIRPSPSVLDGSFASNAWLQECPEPFTKQVWGNALWLSPQDADGMEDGDLVQLASDGAEVTLPILIVEGQAPQSGTLHFGYGREDAGPIGTGIGQRVQDLGSVATLRRIEGREEIRQVQTDFSQHGRNLLQTTQTLTQSPPRPSFYEPREYDGYAWGMVIDTDACIGCNACMIACQSENNIPVVGPGEIARGRNMHWMRVDGYTMDNGGHGFQPVPCMHCEEAPCEPVCPVEASVHDSEGLNVQVYNRCIGTRFCQANCPYKVRRFNFYDYTDKEAFENQGADLLQALRNPDVSVRSRGVMEKCTYCVQRISSARRTAKKENRAIADGEVVTACQSACPSEAITFGDLNDPGSAVTRAKQDPRHYTLLEHLGTRPRTTYLARVEPGPREEEA